MLTPTADGVAFRHELSRLTIEGTLAPYRSAVLHRAALAALQRPPAGAPDPARLAHHAEAAGDAAAVLEFAPAAAARAVASAPTARPPRSTRGRCASRRTSRPTSASPC